MSAVLNILEKKSIQKDISEQKVIVVIVNKHTHICVQIKLEFKGETVSLRSCLQSAKIVLKLQNCNIKKKKSNI